MWWYEFVDHGERYRGAIGKVSKTMAREVETRKKAEVAEGRYKPPSKKPSLRLDEFIEDYFAYYRTNRKPRSVKRHEVSWHAVQPVLGAKRLDEIAPLDLERYRRQRKQSDVSDVTVNRELAFLKHLYTMAIKWSGARPQRTRSRTSD